MTERISTTLILPPSQPTFATTSRVDEAIKQLMLFSEIGKVWLLKHRRLVIFTSVYSLAIATTAYFGLRKKEKAAVPCTPYRNIWRNPDTPASVRSCLPEDIVKVLSYEDPKPVEKILDGGKAEQAEGLAEKLKKLRPQGATFIVELQHEDVESAYMLALNEVSWKQHDVLRLVDCVLDHLLAARLCGGKHLQTIELHNATFDGNTFRPGWAANRASLNHKQIRVHLDEPNVDRWVRFISKLHATGDLTLSGPGITADLVRPVLERGGFTDLGFVNCSDVKDDLIKDLLNWNGEAIDLVDPGLSNDGMLGLLAAIADGQEKLQILDEEDNVHYGAVTLKLINWKERENRDLLAAIGACCEKPTALNRVEIHAKNKPKLACLEAKPGASGVWIWEWDASQVNARAGHRATPRKNKKG